MLSSIVSFFRISVLQPKKASYIVLVICDNNETIPGIIFRIQNMEMNLKIDIASAEYNVFL